jgi:hypothetical protein
MVDVLVRLPPFTGGKHVTLPQGLVSFPYSSHNWVQYNMVVQKAFPGSWSHYLKDVRPGVKKMEDL